MARQRRRLQEQPIRILILSNFFPPFQIGGYEMRCQEVARHLRERGHSIRVVTGKYRGGGNLPAVPRPHSAGGAPFEVPEIAAAATENRRTPDAIRDLHLAWGPPFVNEDLGGLLEDEWIDREVVARQIEKFQPEVISIWGMEFASQPLVHWVAGLGIPVHVAIEDLWLATGYQRDALCQSAAAIEQLSVAIPNALGPLLDLRGRRPDLCAAHVNFVSHFLKRRYESTGFQADSITVTHAGIELPPRAMVDAQTAERDRDADRPLRVLFVGQVTADRGVGDLLAAAAEACRALAGGIQVRLVGGCNTLYENCLREMVAGLGRGRRLSVEFAGHLDRAALSTAYGAADVLAAPSRLPEGLPRVLMEAMATGTPVISTTSGAQPEILDNGRLGTLVAAGDVGALATALVDAQRNQRHWRARAAIAREYALQNFKLSNFVDALEGQLQTLANRARSGTLAAHRQLAHATWNGSAVADFTRRCGRAAASAAQADASLASADRAWRLGVLLKRTGRLAAARSIFCRLLERDSASVATVRRSTFHLGELAMLDGNWAEATRWFVRCLETTPDHAKAAFDLAWADRRELPSHLARLAAPEVRAQPILAR